MDGIKWGCAPIAWTNDDMPKLGAQNTFEQCISEMSLSGYEGTEIGNKYPKNANELSKYLELRNLEVASAWFSSFITTKPLEEVEKKFIEHRNFLYKLGAEVIVVSEQGHSIQKEMDTPFFGAKPQLNSEDWNFLMKGLESLGELANEKHMKLVYHHHMGTVIQTTEEINQLMNDTNPDKVSLLYDTGHLVCSGEDPLNILQKHFSRIHHVHFKDIRVRKKQEALQNNYSFLQAIKKGLFTVPGDGDIDFQPIMDHIAKQNYKGWIVVEAEQDPAIYNPFKYAKKAKEYINTLIQKNHLL